MASTNLSAHSMNHGTSTNSLLLGARKHVVVESLASQIRRTTRYSMKKIFKQYRFHDSNLILILNSKYCWKKFNNSFICQASLALFVLYSDHPRDYNSDSGERNNLPIFYSATSEPSWQSGYTSTASNCIMSYQKDPKGHDMIWTCHMSSMSDSNILSKLNFHHGSHCSLQESALPLLPPQQIHQPSSQHRRVSKKCLLK